MPRENNPLLNIEITKDLTIPKLFLDRYKRFGPKKVAMREKEFGIWRPYTWEDYFNNVKWLCLGLVSLGFKKGNRIALMGDNRPEGLWTELAAICAGGVCVWLFQDSMVEEVRYIVDHSDAVFFVGETQEEIDKALEIKDRCPKLKMIFYDDPRGMRNYKYDFLMSLKELIDIGKKKDKEDPDLFLNLISQGKGDDICLQLYTSGTTGKPKGVLLSHYNLLKMGKNFLSVDPCYEDDEFVSYLPFAWIGEQMMSLACGIIAGYTINFPEEPETAMQNIREIGPHFMFAPPRLYESLTRQVQVKYMDASWLKRKVYEFGMSVGYKMAELKLAKKKIPFYLKLLNFISYWILHKKLRDHLGMSNLRRAYTGGAAISPDHFKFFHAIGVNLKQVYGQTEIVGIAFVHRDNDIKFNTVGRPIPETEVKIAEDGEILCKSPCVFQGYYKNEEATKKTIKNGWLHTQDKGFIDEDGHLIVFDRSKDIITLKDGKPFSPQYLETRLKFSPYIQEAWIIGDKKDYLCAVICIDYTVVGKWADEKKINYTSYSELSQKPEVYDLIQSQIERINKELPEPAKIRKFTNLFKVFDADDGELTRTNKLRRAFLEQRYAKIIEALYQDRDKVDLDITITYEDGRTQRIQTTLKIRKLTEPVQKNFRTASN